MLPIQALTFLAFLGDQEATSTLLLSDAYSPGGSQNLWVDKLGRIRLIDGFAKQTASPVTTDTGGSAARWRELFPYRRTAAGVITRQVIGVLDDGVNEWEIHYSTDSGATWTFIADLGATSVGFIPDFAQFGDTLLITNGVVAVRAWDGTTLTTAGSTQLAAPAVADGGSGALTGTFQWRIVPRKTDGTRKPGSAASAVTQFAAKQANLTWVADPDTMVGGYEVYRTTSSGAIFLYVNYVNGRTTVTYTDNSLDETISEQRILQEHGDAPPTGSYFVEIHKQRAWYGRTDTDPRRWYYSDPGDPDSVYTDNAFLDMTDADSMGDVSVGATGNYQGMLVIWLERSVWTISGTGQIIGTIIDWTRAKSNAQVGATWHRTVVRIPAGARYTDADGSTRTTPTDTLAYLTPLKDIRIFDGDNAEVVSAPKSDTLATLNYAQRTKAFARVDTARSHAMWFIPTGSSTEPDTAVVWNYDLGTWHEWTPLNFASVVELETSTAAQLLLAGEARTATGGYIYQMWSGNTFDGTAISGKLMTRPLLLPIEGLLDFTRIKRVRYFDLLFEPDATPTTVTVEILSYNAGDDDAATISDTVSGTGRVRAQLQTGGRQFHGHGCRLRVSTEVTTGPWILSGGALGYQILPGTKRI